MSQTQTSTVPALVIRRTFKAPRERVFAAWTTPDTLRQFMSPDDVKIGDLQLDVRTGGKFRIVMVHADGEQVPAFGVYKEVRPPERLVMTWTWEEDDKSEERETLLTLDFFDRNGETELVLTHENLRSEESRGNHEHGWTSILEKLPSVL